ncbi:protease pro-enzyme activation domain-containing protein [Dyella dinghuensis]|uniref:protease pro-enzyme activation domain-containing protein n=1 Tax=Dyella dinghuensis TaxID=1920169 RepID=UPI00131530C5|nr:protease pro-enzyme activation domain-containing protein [Dyella dinghuensis]
MTLRNGDKAVGPLDFSQPMHVVVALKLRNEQQLDQYIAKPGFRPLTSGQFQMLYAPTKQQAQVVADYLTKAGFSNVKIAAGNALVEADGRADTAQSAFSTSFTHVKTHDGRDAYANSSAVQIPANLQDVVHAVLGLQNVHISHAMTRPYDPFAAHAMAPQSLPEGDGFAHQPSDFPVIYGASGMAPVTSVSVGSISTGPMTNVLSDLQTADPGVTVTLRGDTAVGNGGGSNSDDSEWDLDSQNIIAFTGVKQYYFYVANSHNDSDLQVAIAQVVSDNLLKAIDYSMGECETDAQSDGEAATGDSSFKQAVAQGQTFFVSAGDTGADECNNGTNTPSWPASSPYVTSVGGTSLLTSPATTWQIENVWNDNNLGDGATGGSPSTFEPIPIWQQGVTGITNQTYRGVPDIAFDGSPITGALITVDGQPNQAWGGTSLSAPLAVGMWAHVLQADGTNLGFATPVIYKVAQLSKLGYATAFHDITAGNNDGYSAVVGWDYTSGWGSVIVNGFANLATVSISSSNSPLVSFGTLPALQVTTPIPGSMHTPGDFNGDGTSDILWFNPWLSQIGLWSMTATESSNLDGGGVTRDALSTYNITPGYFVGAVGDFNNDGFADLVFTSANRDLYMWTNNQHGGWTSTYIGTYPSQWQLIGAGDVNGDGDDDLLWLNPSACEFAYWTMQGATRIGSKIIPVACGYYPISIGYYTSSNRLSILWTSAANDLYMWDSNGSSNGTGFNAYDLTSYLPANSQIMSIGGGYQGQNIGVRVYIPGMYGTQGQGMLWSRSFDTNGNQTGIQVTPIFGPNVVDTHVGSAGYLIAGNGVNNTAVYNFDPDYMYLSTGGLQNIATDDVTGNAPEYPALQNTYQSGDYWSYPNGWWVVGALFNGAASPPWQ